MQSKLSESYITPLADFDSLPDSAEIRIETVSRLFSISKPTVWRWSKSGHLPTPRKFGKHVTTWNVGQIRKVMRDGVSMVRP